MKKDSPFVQNLNSVGWREKYFRDRGRNARSENARVSHSNEILEFPRIMRVAFCQKAHLVHSWNVYSPPRLPDPVKKRTSSFSDSRATITFVRAASSICISGCCDVPLFSPNYRGKVLHTDVHGIFSILHDGWFFRVFLFPMNPANIIERNYARFSKRL